jgi:tetratricopeptide (TPR) repeat protein
VSRRLKITIVCCVAVLILVFAMKSRLTTNDETRTDPTVQRPEIPISKSSSNGGSKKAEGRRLGVTAQTSGLSKSKTNELIELTEENFESNVLSCFRGEPCRLMEKPSKLYKDFKLAGDRKAIDHLISFLRSQLKDPDFRALYKDELKDMIDDFYPPNERQFQDAAYYSYLGDLQKSLDLYLDLEQRAQTNPDLRAAPKLNIANVLFDMKRYSDALPYYQAALADYNSGAQQQVAFPDPREMIAFIERRIWRVRLSG